MQTWLNFWIFLFWISITGFLINPSNFLFLILFSEITWTVLYCSTILTAAVTEDLNLLTLSFLILGLASVEFGLGYILIIIFNNFNKNLNLFEIDNFWYKYVYKNSNKFNVLTITKNKL